MSSGDLVGVQVPPDLPGVRAEEEDTLVVHPAAVKFVYVEGEADLSTAQKFKSV